MLPADNGAPRNLMLVAGEPSGDAYLGELALELKKRHRNYRFSGMGGVKMRAAGVRLLADCNKTSVVGIFEVAKVYRKLHKAFNKLLAEMQESADLLILADFPDFNLRLAAKAKELGVKTLFFISPQIWAWRKSRIKKIASCVDMMAVIFPFEERIYRDEGIPCTFVGHPLVKKVVAARVKASDDSVYARDKTLILLMPGSRKAEIRQHLRVLCKTAKNIARKEPNARFLIPLAPGLSELEIHNVVTKSDLSIEIYKGPIYGLMKRASLAITASGTATFELSLCKTPMVVIYKVQALSYLVIKWMILTQYISMPNIIAGKMIVPELAQREATPEKISAKALDILQNKEIANEMKDELEKVASQFEGKDATLSLCHLVTRLLTQA